VRVVLLGPPGAGKGTQAVRLASERGLPHIATGDMLREAVARGEPVGRRAKEYMDRGALVPDGVMLELVRLRLARPDARNGFVLDGFPRTVPQAEGLAQITALDAVVLFEIAESVLVERLSGRRVCSDTSCGATYHVRFAPPAREGTCDRCGSALTQRSDDREEAVRRRLALFREQTAPLEAYYETRGLLRRIAAEGTPDAVARALAAVLPR
jgi:adenylate kinase